MCARVTLLGQPMLLLSSRVASTRVSHFEAVRPSTGDTFRCIPPPLYLLASDIRSLFTVVHGCKILRYCILKVFPIIAEIKKEDLLSSSSLRNIFFYTFSLLLFSSSISYFPLLRVIPFSRKIRAGYLHKPKPKNRTRIDPPPTV